MKASRKLQISRALPKHLPGSHVLTLRLCLRREPTDGAQVSFQHAGLLLVDTSLSRSVGDARSMGFDAVFLQWNEYVVRVYEARNKMDTILSVGRKPCS